MGYYATLIIRDLWKQVGADWHRSGGWCPGAEEQGTHLLRPLTNPFFPGVYELLVWFVSRGRHKLEGRKKKITSGHEKHIFKSNHATIKTAQDLSKASTLVLAQLLQLHHLEVNPQKDVGNHAKAAVARSILRTDTRVSRGSPPLAGIPGTCPPVHRRAQRTLCSVGAVSVLPLISHRQRIVAENWVHYSIPA